MIIIKLWGGLGNQMFQYALYLSYQKKDINAKLDKSFFDSVDEHNGFELGTIFPIKPRYCSSLEKIVVKAITKPGYKIFDYPYDEKKGGYGYYNQKIADLKFGYLKGYWQTEKYFKQIQNEVRTQFIFPLLTDEKNLAILKKIKETNSISIHIRRGDYLLKDRNWAINTDYYKNAISLIDKKIADAFYFIFSDDINWARQNIKERNVEFIDWNTNENSYKDMQLMSNCKHNIIANSSFSWWGAWLNSNPEKIVIAPDNWVDMNGTRDVLAEGWMTIK